MGAQGKYKKLGPYYRLCNGILGARPLKMLIEELSTSGPQGKVALLPPPLSSRTVSTQVEGSRLGITRLSESTNFPLYQRTPHLQVASVVWIHGHVLSYTHSFPPPL